MKIKQTVRQKVERTFLIICISCCSVAVILAFIGILDININTHFK